MLTYLRSKRLVLAFIFSLMIVGCCDTVDSTAQDGYPYGDWHQLNLYDAHTKYYKELRQVFSNNRIEILTSRSQCDTLIKRIDPNCNCNDIDFDQYSLVMFNGTVQGGYSLYSSSYQPRAIINHREKTYLCELRGMRKTCSSTTNMSMPTGYHEYKLVPKVPDNYRFRLDYVTPILSD